MDWMRRPSEQWIHECHVLLDSGFNIVESMHALRNQNKLSSCLHQHLQSGWSLYQAVSFYPKHFHTLECHMIRLGELTGQLEIVFKQLYAYQVLRSQWKSDILSVLFYPVIVLFMSLFLCIGLSTWLVPALESMMHGAWTDMPSVTVWVIKIGHGCQSIGWVGLCLIFLGFIGLMRWKGVYIIWHMPYIGSIYQGHCLIRWLSILSLALQSGLILLEGLELSLQMMIHPYYQKCLAHSIYQVRSGYWLSETLQSHHWIPELVIDRFKIAEQSGTLNQVLDQLIRQYQLQLNQSIRTVKRLSEPFLLIFLSIAVGMIVVGMYAPLASLGDRWA